VMNMQREIVYGFRGDVVRSDAVREIIYDIMNDVIESTSETMLVDSSDAVLHDYVEWVQMTFPIPLRLDEIKSANAEDVADNVFKRVQRAYELKVSLEDPSAVPLMERQIVLQAIDNHWQEYLRAMDGLRQGVGLRAYGQRDPLVEYKREAFTMFEHLMSDIKTEIVNSVFRMTTAVDSFDKFLESLTQTLVHDEVSMLGSGGSPAATPKSSRASFPDDLMAGLPSSAPASSGGGSARYDDKVGRNDPCPCGSGKKYKKCCGQ
jgi:preprotein translocase subunit SecA